MVHVIPNLFRFIGRIVYSFITVVSFRNISMGFPDIWEREEGWLNSRQHKCSPRRVYKRQEVEMAGNSRPK